MVGDAVARVVVVISVSSVIWLWPSEVVPNCCHAARCSPRIATAIRQPPRRARGNRGPRSWGGRLTGHYCRVPTPQFVTPGALRSRLARAGAGGARRGALTKVPSLSDLFRCQATINARTERRMPRSSDMAAPTSDLASPLPNSSDRGAADAVPVIWAERPSALRAAAVPSIDTDERSAQGLPRSRRSA